MSTFTTCRLFAHQPGVYLEKNLQGNHEDQWVQQLQEDQAHPKIKQEGQKPHLNQLLKLAGRAMKIYLNVLEHILIITV